MASRLLRDLVGPGEQATPDPLAELSAREREVLPLLAQGLRRARLPSTERLILASVERCIRCF